MEEERHGRIIPGSTAPVTPDGEDAHWRKIWKESTKGKSDMKNERKNRKIKRLQRELAAERQGRREATKAYLGAHVEAMKCSRAVSETAAAMDAILVEVAMKFGAVVGHGTYELTIPGRDVGETLRRFRVSAERRDGGFRIRVVEIWT